MYNLTGEMQVSLLLAAGRKQARRAGAWAYALLLMHEQPMSASAAVEPAMLTAAETERGRRMANMSNKHPAETRMLT